MNLKKIKICGITTPQILQACIDIGVGFVGFNFVPKSPRYIDIQTAVSLAQMMPSSIAKVALVVNEAEATIKEIITELNPDYIQFHGTETVDYLADIKSQFNIKIIKAIAIATQADIELIPTYQDCADIILCDAKAITPSDTTLTGGHGQSFDWGLLRTMPKINKPIMLAGGLNYYNLLTAQTQTNADYFDICSGVEEAKGQKSEILIRQLQGLFT